MSTEDVNSFERFSLRAARTLLVASIAVGCVAIVVGLLVAGGAWFLPDPVKPVRPTPPTPAKATIEDAEHWAEGHASDMREIEQSALSLAEPGTLPAALMPLFPETAYALTDVWEEYCRASSDYGCLQRGKRIKQPSVARTFTALFRDVGAQRRDQLLAVLGEQLPKVAVEKRLGMVIPVVVSHLQVQKENENAAEAHEARVRELDSEFESAVSTHGAEKIGYSIGGLTAAGWGLGCVIASSVFVALMAIERHLRALRVTGRDGGLLTKKSAASGE